MIEYVLMPKSPFLEIIRSEIRLRGYSLKTEKTYIHWIKRYIYFHNKRHPNTMGGSRGQKLPVAFSQ
ncbi:phage integrase N-terminal SAM-like domain-containing protein [Oceanospirillum beijerinckii]|uniref:phage integrase N-terminal SAM-like domain-containing protein n=1 Tax=Oceanospirillum beijerinckii TaxID=64976 RepID=UPI00316AD349